MKNTLRLLKEYNDELSKTRRLIVYQSGVCYLEIIDTREREFVSDSLDALNGKLQHLLSLEEEETITVSLGYMSRNQDWTLFCDVTGISYYALNEGADPKSDVVLTLTQARRCGLNV